MNKYQLTTKSIYLILNLTLAVLIMTICQTQSVYSQTPTKKAASRAISPTLSPTLGVVEKLKKIEQLKEKIATKVAELRESEKGAFSGTVKKINSNQMTISTRTGDRTVTFSEDTIIYSYAKNTRAETNIKEVKEGQTIALFGYFDEKREVLSVKYIYIFNPAVHIIGKIADIDKTNYSITVKEAKGTTLVDIETSTKTYILGKENNLLKGGFSKFNIGDVVHIQGNTNSKKENAVTADRVVIASQSASLIPSVSPTPTKKITPIPTQGE